MCVHGRIFEKFEADFALCGEQTVSLVSEQTLCCVVPRIFGFAGDEGDDIIYVNWLNMVRAGLLALEFYSPETRAWRQVTR